MGFWEFLMDKTVGGVLKGAGEFAKDIRTAVTGNAPLSAEQKAQLLAQAAAIEAAAAQAEVDLQKAQIDVNKEEAKSDSLFKGGWRPGAGWVCVLGLGYTFLVRPILPWFLNLFLSQPLPEMPALEMADLMAILGGMLGLGFMRSKERIAGKA